MEPAEVVTEAREARDQHVHDLEARIRELREAIGDLRAMLHALEKARRDLLGADAPRPQKDSRQIAGPAAIKLVADALSLVGRTTQAAITKDVDKNSGTVSHALRALEADGKARTTGRSFKGSDEWVWTGETRRVTEVHAGEGVREGRRTA